VRSSIRARTTALSAMVHYSRLLGYSVAQLPLLCHSAGKRIGGLVGRASRNAASRARSVAFPVEAAAPSANDRFRAAFTRGWGTASGRFETVARVSRKKSLPDPDPPVTTGRSEATNSFAMSQVGDPGGPARFE